jgi:hypothetical protein
MQVLTELNDFETLPGVKPFAGLTAKDLKIIHYETTLFDGILPGKLETDTEVCRFIIICFLYVGLLYFV